MLFNQSPESRMKSNPFFHLLKNDPNLDGRVVALDVTEQQNPYFRIAFEHARDGLPDAIKEAHLSIFQQFDPHTPALSAAHCTVLIKLSDTLFRFHLYFDEQEILIASHCDQQNAEGYEAAILPETFDQDKMIADILRFSLPVFRQLRLDRQTIIDDLTKQYAELEEKSSDLSQNLPANQEVYLANVVALKDIVKKLSALSTASKWQPLYAYFTKLHQALKSDAEREHLISPSTAEEPSQITAPIDKIDQAVTPTPALTMFSPPHCRDFRALNTLFSHYQRAPDENSKQQDLIKLNHHLLAINLEHISLNELDRFKKIQNYVQKETTFMTNKALLSKDFVTADRLISLYNEDVFNVMNLALMHLDKELVAFLVEKLHFPLLSQPIVIKKQTCSNIVAYCYQHAETMPELIDIFELLFLHDTSIIYHPLDMDLPLAHWVLTTHHPLMAVFEKHSEKTLANKQFYQHLINACQRIDNKDSSIMQALDDYEQKKTQVGNSQSIFTTPTLKALQKFEALVMNKVGDVLEQIENLPEIIKRQEELGRRYRDIIRQYKDFTQMYRGYNTNVNHLIQQEYSLNYHELSQLDLDEMIEPEELRQAMMEYYDMLESCYDKQLQLLDVEKGLARYGDIHGRRLPKKYKELVARKQAYTQDLAVMVSELRVGEQLRQARLEEEREEMTEMTEMTEITEMTEMEFDLSQPIDDDEPTFTAALRSLDSLEATLRGLRENIRFIPINEASDEEEDRPSCNLK